MLVVTTYNYVSSLIFVHLFGFFCMSNLVQISTFTFHTVKHLCRGDMLFEQTQAVIIVKWSKTLQTIKKGTNVIIPRLNHNVLCPVKALGDMFTEFSASRNAPLFSCHSATLCSNPPLKIEKKMATS